MDDQLLVRVYNVGLGDCIYLRVPDKERNVHILIDCGNKFGPLDLLGESIELLKTELPDAGRGKKRLDLLVVTLPNEDHCKGFQEEFFSDIEIDRIWLSPAFDRLNPKAQGFHALQAASRRGLMILSEKATGEMKENVDAFLELELNQDNQEAIQTLCHFLPMRNHISPLYVSADTPQEVLDVFDDEEISLKVLGPMADIDSYYVGGEGLVNFPAALLDPVSIAIGYQALFPPSGFVQVEQPGNISTLDFKLLRSRVLNNALALAEVAGYAMNNLSVVLLLEWHGRRLLFSGDAEWSEARKGAVKDFSSNGSWNVMWQERKADLSKPLDFYKIGHHGSENATPWAPWEEGEKIPAINQILDAMLPVPQPGEERRAYAVASTTRTTRWPSIPNAELMKAIGMRVANSRTEYVEKTVSPYIVPTHTPQPQRTDLEEQASGAPVPYIQISFDPVT